jgi:anti-anti-sigma factor
VDRANPARARDASGLFRGEAFSYTEIGCHPTRAIVNVTTRHYADTIVAAPVGRIDHRSAADLEAALAPLLARFSGGSNGALVLDFAGVDYISSVGLRVLMIAAKQMRAQQARLSVAALQSVVAEIFTISRFDKVLDVHPTLEAALASSPAALVAYRQAMAGAAGPAATP